MGIRVYRQALSLGTQSRSDEPDVSIGYVVDENTADIIPGNTLQRISGVLDVSAETMERLAEVEQRPGVNALHVANYAPSKTLTQANFEQALRDALAAAYVLCAARYIGAPGESWNAVAVVMPEGTWPMADTLAMPSFNAGGLQIQCPALVGAGKTKTILKFSAASGGAAIVLGDDSDYVWYPELRDFTICAASTLPANGILFQHVFKLHLRDVQARGFAGGSYDSGCGFKFRRPLWESGYVNQHAQIYDCEAVSCDYGIHLRYVNQGILQNFTANQCLVHDVVYDKAFGFAIVSGVMQGLSEKPVGHAHRSTYWWGGKQRACMISGWTELIRSGGGATCGVRESGDLCTVTLSGGCTTEDEARWLVLSGGSALVNGIYVIAEYVNATTLKIEKGTTHAEESGLSWEVRSSYGGSNFSVGGYPYHEGDALAFLRHLRDETTHSDIFLHGVTDFNCRFTLWVHKSTGSFECKCSQNAVKAVYARHVAGLIVDRPESKCEVGGYTRPVFQASNFVGNGGPEKRIRSWVKARKFLGDWIVGDGVALAGSDVEEWQDQINGYSLLPVSGAAKAQYVASDSEFVGKPVIEFVAGASQAATASYRVTIPAADVRGWGVSLGLIVICRRTTTDHPGPTFHVLRTVSGSQQCTLEYGTNTGGYASPTYPFSGLLYATAFGNSAWAPLVQPAVDTKPTWFSLTQDARDRSRLQRNRLHAYQGQGYYEQRTKAEDLTLTLSQWGGGTSAPMRIARVLITDRPITAGELEQLQDLVALEYPSVDV